MPRPLGFDDQGRQMLSYLPGEVIGGRQPWPAWVYRDDTLEQVGRWLRRVHDASATFVPPPDARWFTGDKLQPGMVIGHQDAAPYNAVMDGDRLAGFFDWDTASPSPARSIWASRRCCGCRSPRSPRPSWSATTGPRSGPGACTCCSTHTATRATALRSAR
ncbi:aminoglycoside phosphotransferase/kinase family protein [Paractinoplanes durhamensis]|uniref:hypothetical protein n=1 Tax=Paractinoplanes durhamensis TaxID=113563 RepID=UPI00362DFE54